MLRHLLLAALAVSTMFASQLNHQTEEWAALFHVKNNRQSDISDPSFYLSKEKTLESEYHAALSILNQEDASAALCRYPARFRYLSKKLDLNLSFKHCDNFMQFLNESRGEAASISFASAYLESPMSLFGHTFITVHKPNNRFFSQTISFAAEVHEKVNFFELAGKGIGGGFSGKFVATPYFKLFESYNMVEQRGISEYRLNLNQEEIENMLWHVYELYDISVDYKFLTNNCAFETLWLLEVARPDMNIVDRFNGIVIPYQTIQDLKELGFIDKIQTQPSSLESMFATYSTLDSYEKDFFRNLQSNEHKHEMIQNSLLSQSGKDKMGYLINGYYDLLFKRYRMGKPDFDDVKAIPYTPRSELVDEEPSRRGGTKIELGYFKDEGREGTLVSLKPYSMNRIEDQFSGLGDATLEIMNMDLRRIGEHERIESLSVFNLESYTKRFDFYKPLSWKFQIGADRPADYALSSVVRFGIGGSWGSENILGYFVPQITYYPFLDNVGLDIISGVGYWHDNIHFGIDYIKPVAYMSKLTEETYNFYGMIQFSKTSLKISCKSNDYQVSVIYQF